MGSDFFRRLFKPRDLLFQSTLPHGERQRQMPHGDGNQQFQSTLPHGERLQYASRRRGGAQISIHAPAWGATDGWIPATRVIIISIHAPAWGATLSQLCDCFILQFQSTLPHGERQMQARLPSTYLVYFNPRSRMGSDLFPGCEADRFRHFNPRSRMGSDMMELARATRRSFQSTLPHGERHRRQSCSL